MFSHLTPLFLIHPYSFNHRLAKLIITVEQRILLIETVYCGKCFINESRYGKT